MSNLKWHSIDRKACAITKVNNRFTHTVTLCPADRVSSGKVSLGISHPNGPHDHANADTNVHTMINDSSLHLHGTILLHKPAPPRRRLPCALAPPRCDAPSRLPCARRLLPC
ncbi:unnamed protein product [Linum trigynum]|uniref:Uncharacterized protein n=1 Tax=Linum trigynum TaxID=586398 RepID=A0AAV2EQS8_9ROSI